MEVYVVFHQNTVIFHDSAMFRCQNNANGVRHTELSYKKEAPIFNDCSWPWTTDSHVM